MGIAQAAFTCSKLTMETLEQCVKSLQSWQLRHQNDVKEVDVVLVSLVLTLNRFHPVFWVFHCWLWTIKYGLSWRQKSFNFTNKWVLLKTNITLYYACFKNIYFLFRNINYINHAFLSTIIFVVRCAFW